MLRLVIVALLAAGACQHPDKLPVDRQVAGTVVELDGTITATSMVGTRTLHAKDGIGEDETIDTHEGHVVIVLTHNHARWELGPNHHGARVSESAAWKLALQDQPIIPVAEQSTPAGREAEPRAVDTAASTTEHRPTTADPGKPTPKTPSHGGKQDPQVVSKTTGTSVGRDRPVIPPKETVTANDDEIAETGAEKPQTPTLKNSRRGDAASGARRIIAADAGVRSCATAAMHITVACTAAKCTLSSSVAEPARACLARMLPKLDVPTGDYTAEVELAP